MGPLGGFRQIGGIPKDIPALVQDLLLPRCQLRTFQLLDLILKGVHPSCLFALVHLQGGNLSVQIRQGLISRPVGPKRCLGLAEPVQILQMAILVQKLLTVMLAVDIEKLAAQSFQLGHRHRTTIDPAEILSVGHDLPLKEKFSVFIGYKTILRQPGKSRRPGKGPRYQSGLRPCTDQFPAGPFTGNGAHGIHHNGLAGARLTGKGVEAGPKKDIRRFDHSDIFNMKNG